MLKLFDAVRCFSNILYIANHVVKTEIVKNFIHYGYHYCGSCAPHLAILFKILDTEKNCIWKYIPIKLVQEASCKNKSTYLMLPIARGLYSLAYTVGSNNRKKMRKFISNGIKNWCTAPSIIKNLLQEQNKKNNQISNFRQFKEFSLIRKNIFFDSSFSFCNFKWCVFGLTLLIPKLAYFLQSTKKIKNSRKSNFARN